MIPFSLHCTTCGAALRVTDVAAIGQILPCPKCASMVHVVPPLTDVARVQIATGPLSGGEAGRSAASPKLQQQPEWINTASPRVIEPFKASSVVLPTPPPLPRSAPGRFIHSFQAVAILAGAISLVTVVWGLWAYFGEPTQPLVSEAPKISDAEIANGIERSDSAQTPASAELSSGSTVDDVVARPNDSTDSQATPNAGPSLSIQPEVDSTHSHPAKDNPESMTKDNKALAPAAVENEATAHSTVEKLVSSEPDSTRLTRKPSIRIDELPKPSGVTIEPAEPSVDVEANLASAEALVEPPVQAAQGAGEDAQGPIAPLAEQPLRRIGPRPVDVPAQLAVKIPNIELHEVTLCKLLESISDLTLVPISVDADAVRAAGVSLEETVSAAGKSQSASAFLDEALRPLSLRVREQNGQLIVEPSSARQMRRANYAVDDLIRAGDPTADDLIDMIRLLLPTGPIESDPTKLQISLSDKAIVLTATEVVHDRMIELCEKLRVARGRPLRSHFDRERPDLRFDPRRFELVTRHAASGSLLGRRITAGVGHPVSLREVVDFLANQTQTTFLIDHSALAAAGLTSETEVRLSATDRTLEEVLAQLLAPLGLAYRVLDTNAVEISTPQVISNRRGIEFYSLRGVIPSGSNATVDWDTHRERLLKAAGVDASAAVLVYDPPSKCLIVSAAFPDQVRIERAIQSAPKP